MPFNYTLTLTITGDSLGAIDDQLVEAAGQRLQARMIHPLAMPTFVAPVAQTVAREPAPIPLAVPKVETRGRKPGGKNKPKEQPIHAPAADAAPAESEDQDNSGDEAISEAAVPTPPVAQNTVKEHASPRSDDNTFIDAPIGVHPDAVAALTAVNSKFNIDKAREVLAHFNVKTSRDLRKSQLAIFLKHCRDLCG